MGKFLCKVHHFVISLSQTASVLILVVTTVERYCVITRPVRGRHLLTMRRRRVIPPAYKKVLYFFSMMTEILKIRFFFFFR